jgi:Holliday junction resolvasome RuvABC DNA-binding subunit
MSADNEGVNANTGDKEDEETDIAALLDLSTKKRKSQRAVRVVQQKEQDQEQEKPKRMPLKQLMLSPP